MSFNPAMSFMQGQQAGQAMKDRRAEADEKRLRGLAAQLGEQSEAYKELMVKNPEAAMKLKQTFSTDDGGANALIDDAHSFLYHIATDPSGASAMTLLNNRIQNTPNWSGKTSKHSENLRNILATEGPEAAKANVENALAIMAGIKGGGKDGRTSNQKDWATFQNLMSKAEDTGNPKDKVKAERYGRGVGFIRESEQEKSDIKVTQKEREAMVKANVVRKQGFIDSGIEMATGAANIRRALTLLDEVETGGFDNLALKARQLFGIEGADEGEVSSLMGKAVLSQLKPIFGAAFTAVEGEKLATLEAKFGRSSASNKRLLNNALKIIDRAARRGIAAAEDQEDFFTADEIRGALAFKLEDKAPQSSQQTGMSEQDKQALEWARANANDPRAAAILQKMGVK